MASFQFYCPPNRMTKAWAELGYAFGYDLMPWQTWIDYQPGSITAHVEDNDSVRFCCPWYQKGMGVITLSTSTLSQRERPYNLCLEMARAQIGTVRAQLFEWQQIGLAIPPNINEYLKTATSALGRAARNQYGPSAVDAILHPELVPTPPKPGEESNNSLQVKYPEDVTSLIQESSVALQYALEAGNMLAQSYVSRRYAVAGNSSKLAEIGCSLGSIVPAEPFSSIFTNTFKTARIDINWRKMEQLPKYQERCVRQMKWCKKNGIKCAVGPLIRFEEHYFPEWLTLYSDDFEAVCDYVRVYITKCVELFRDYVDIWYAASKINVGETLGLNEEQRVQITAIILETLQKLKVTGEVGVSLSQPFDEGLGRQNSCFTAYYYAEVLFNCGLKIDFIDLNLDIGFTGDGTQDRDPLQYSRLLDTWINAGIPISISLSVPGIKNSPGNAQLKLPYWTGWTYQAQQTWIRRCLPIFWVKPRIKRIIWNTILDPQEKGLFSTGLFDVEGHAKPALKAIMQMQKALDQTSTS